MVYEALEQLWKIMAFQNNGTTSQLVDFLMFCASAKSSVTLSPSGTLSSSVISISSTIVMAHNYTTQTSSFTKSQHDPSPQTMFPTPVEITDQVSSSYEIDSFTPNVDDVVMTPSVDLSQEEKKRFAWLNVRNMDECEVALQQFKNYIDDVILAPYGHIKRDQEFFNLADLYYDKYDKERLGQYSECFALIEEGKKNLDYFWNVLDLINSVTQGNLVAMKNLISHEKIFQCPKLLDNFDPRLQTFCGWRESFIDIIQTESEYALKYILEVRTFLSEAKKIVIDFRDILVSIGIDNPYSTDNIRQYLAKEITKQELAMQFLSLQNVTEREKYFQVLYNIDFLIQKYFGQINRIISSLHLTSRLLTDIFDNNSIQQLELVRKAIRVESMAEFARRGDLKGIISEINNAINENIKQLNQYITDPLLEIRLKLKSIEANLREYNDSIKMDSQFYL